MKVRSALMIPGTENIGWVQLITISMGKLKGIKNQGATSGATSSCNNTAGSNFHTGSQKNQEISIQEKFS